MKVLTSLKAGGIIADTTQKACNTCSASTSLINQAEQDADKVVGILTASTKTLYNCIKKTFG